MNGSFRRMVLELHYKIYSLINEITPKDSNMIFIYDAPFMRQNCWAFYRYLIETGYDEKYKIYYYTEKPIGDYSYNLRKGVVSNCFLGWFLHLRAKYTFYEYHTFKFSCKPKNGQVYFYLTHGMPLKNYGYTVSKPEHPFEDDYTFLLMTSEFYIPIMKKVLGCADKQIYIGGLPRCDQLFNKKDLSWLIKPETKNVLWMPTFRKSSRNFINDSNNEFPLLTNDNIKTLDEILKNNDIQLIIKPHPLQDRIDWLYDGQYENIRVIVNEDLLNNHTELYELIGCVDMLCTDYSSVYSDFLLTKKAIIFVADDIDEYKKNRGFVDERLLHMLPGPQVKNFDEFVNSILSIEKIENEYKSKINFLQCLLSPYPKSGSYCKDLCDFLKL